jgi:hypothetical protein
VNQPEPKEETNTKPLNLEDEDILLEKSKLDLLSKPALIKEQTKR